MTIQLHRGRYGDARAINSHSAQWYRDRGVDAPGIWGNGRIHPFAEHLLSNGAAPNPGEVIINGACFATVDDLFDRSHPLDHKMEMLAAQWAGVANVSCLTMDAAWQDALATAVGVLETYAPEAWASTREFVSRVYIARDVELSGISFDDSLGALVLGAEKNADHFELCANFYHEALHCKMARITRSFDPVFPETTRECVPIPWWKGVAGKTHWDVRRAVDALHVYIHLAEFSRNYGPDSQNPHWEMAYARTAFRAAYLGRVLNDLPNDLLGNDWKNFVGWLVDCVAEPSQLSPAGWKVLESARFPDDLVL